MVTNQMMNVQIGNFGTLQIGHKDLMGKASQVIEMGNRNRKAKNLEEIPLKEILRKQYFWEFVISRKTQIKRKIKCGDSPHFQNTETTDILKIQSDYTDLKQYKTEEGKIQYGELMKKFQNLIRSKRGRNGGTWAELYILLKIASILDKDLEVEIYRVFIEENLLTLRDIGGDNFNILNDAINKLLELVGLNNMNKHIEVALIIRDKLKILDSRGYNQKEHNYLIQKYRGEYQSSLADMIKVGFIKDFEQLKEVLLKL